MKTLRKIGFLFLAVMLCFNLTACDDDDDEGSSVDPRLLGTWEETWSQGQDIDDLGDLVKWDEAVGGHFITLTADGMGVESYESEDDFNGVFKWWVKGNNQLYILDPSDNTTTHGIIKKVDATTMILYYTEQNFHVTTTYTKVK